MKRGGIELKTTSSLTTTIKPFKKAGSKNPELFKLNRNLRLHYK